MDPIKSYDELLSELQQTQFQLKEAHYQLEEANEMMAAIRSGEVDALIIKADDGHQLYTLENADLSYRIFIEQMSEGAVTLNQDETILYSNSRFAEWVNLSLEKVIGSQISHFILPDERQLWHQLFRDAWEKDIKGELHLSPGGEVQIPVSLSFKMLSMENGSSMSLIISDLTQQKQAQYILTTKNQQLEQAQAEMQYLNANLEQTITERTEELLENQQRLAKILETMAEGVGITDAQGQLTYANPMAQRILGLSHSEILTRTYDDPNWTNLRLDGSPLPSEEHPMAIMLTTGQPVYDAEIAVQPPDRERFFISINAAPVKDEKGNIVAGIGTFMDVTHRRKAIQQKDEFISVASHELRTPITTLKASLQLLYRMKDAPNLKMLPKLIEQSNKSLNKVSVLVNDLLNATKVNQGQLTLHKTHFALAELIEASCHHLETDTAFNLKVDGDRQLSVYADRNRIEQIIVNLVNNAIKYAPQSKTVCVRFDTDGQYVKVCVIDHGPGIPAEKMAHLFERYYRVDSGGHQYSGLGLGLYICAEIIKKHEGQIGVESNIGKGSTFWFMLPVLKNI